MSSCDTRLNRPVALKELRQSFLNDAEWVKRFTREALTIARLNHAHIVTIYDVLETAERLFIVMRLVDGPSLEQLLAEQGSLSWSQALEIITTIAEALDYAHTEGILHRDLKPANILLDVKRGPQLSDFGLAKLASEGGSSVTAAGAIVGTPNYIAPEMWEGQGSSKQSDIYALGCILYEMLTGEKLFGGDSPPAVMMAHFQPLTLPETWPAGVPSGFAGVLETALTRQPAERFATVSEMMAALAELGSLAPTPVVRPITDTSPAPPPDLPAFLEPTAETTEIEAELFVAREPELVRLNGFLQQTLAGQGQLAFVTGEAGRGKTSLVNEFARRALAAHPELIVAGGSCDVYVGVSDPYLPFRELLNTLTGDIEARSMAGAMSRDLALRLWHLLPHSVEALVEHGPALIDTFVLGASLLARTAAAAPGHVGKASYNSCWNKELLRPKVAADWIKTASLRSMSTFCRPWQPGSPCC